MMNKRIGSLALISVLLLTGCSSSFNKGDTYENEETVEQAPPTPSSKGDNEMPELSDSEKELRWCLSVAEEGANIMFLSKEGVRDYVITIYSNEFGNPPSDVSLNTAMENVRADYKENAIRTAEMYKEDSKLDEAGAKSKLKKDKFTDAEIDFAIKEIYK